MTIKEIAHKLVDLCRQGEFDAAYRELFAEDALSCEPEGMPNGKIQGLENMLAKGAQFEKDTEEIFAMEVSEPLVADNHFAVTMLMDLKMKGRPRMKMEEICMYEVKDGKIVKEEFFYSMPEA